jgi:transcriptional regulator with XRE-family HTH domain
MQRQIRQFIRHKTSGGIWTFCILQIIFIPSRLSPPTKGMTMPTYKAGFTPAEKKEFGRRLASISRELGWNGSELARRATAQLPSGSGLEISRDHVSRYLSGQTVPQPLYVDALAAALGRRSTDLLPRPHDQRPKPPSAGDIVVRRLSLDSHNHGLASVVVDATLPEDIAMKIQDLVRKARPRLQKSAQR